MIKIHSRNLPENVLSETKNLKFDWSDNRKDLTFLPFITIDGEDARILMMRL